LFAYFQLKVDNLAKNEQKVIFTKKFRSQKNAQINKFRGTEQNDVKHKKICGMTVIIILWLGH
jgi:hypothetical protein